MKKIFVFVCLIVTSCAMLFGCKDEKVRELDGIKSADNEIDESVAETSCAEDETVPDEDKAEDIERAEEAEFVVEPIDEIEDETEDGTKLRDEEKQKPEKFTYNVQALVSLNVRDKAGTDGKVLGTLNAGDKLPYYTKCNNWYEVKYKDAHAYVSANTQYSQKVDVDAQDKIEKAISVGLTLLGTPYEYGATRVIDYNFNRIKSFTGRTFDCSSFVQYCFYTGAGINLYGDSRTMSKQGVTVKSENIKRGDVIFMTSTARQNKTGIERIGHVAIYIGDNKILHTFGTGGVRVQDYSSFWKGRTIVIKRML